MLISNSTIKDGLQIAGKYLHAPEQKIALTVTALGIQPTIDMNNKEVDKETRKVSTARDIAKLLAGAATGITIRYLGIGAAKKLSKFEPIYDETNKFMVGIKDNCGVLMPKKLIGTNGIKNMFGEKGIDKMLVKDFNDKTMKYIKAMGAILATVTMLYTNFSCDAPWTNKLTPKVYKFLFNEEMDKNKRTSEKKESEVKK